MPAGAAAGQEVEVGQVLRHGAREAQHPENPSASTMPRHTRPRRHSSITPVAAKSTNAGKTGRHVPHPDVDAHERRGQDEERARHEQQRAVGALEPAHPSTSPLAAKSSNGNGV